MVFDGAGRLAQVPIAEAQVAEVVSLGLAVVGPTIDVQGLLVVTNGPPRLAQSAIRFALVGQHL